MRTILPSLDGGVFDPKDITAMSIALGDVCKALGLTDGPIAAREVIAGRIIALAREGERSPTVLRDKVLQVSGAANGQNGHRAASF